MSSPENPGRFRRPEVFDIVAAILRERGVSPADVAAVGPEGVEVAESETVVTLANFLSPVQALGARVRVREQDLEAAQAILDELEDEPVTADDLPPELAEPPCPRCGSSKVTQFTEVIEERAVPNLINPLR
jgi:hypothetical protein